MDLIPPLTPYFLAIIPPSPSFYLLHFQKTLEDNVPSMERQLVPSSTKAARRGQGKIERQARGDNGTQTRRMPSVPPTLSEVPSPLNGKMKEGRGGAGRCPPWVSLDVRTSGIFRSLVREGPNLLFF